MIYNGISFNEEWARSKSVTEFVREFSGKLSLTDAQLREAYSFLNPRKPAPKASDDSSFNVETDNS